MRLSLFFVSFVKLLLVAASQSSSPVPCAPLIDYIEPNSRGNLDIFLGGGAIPDNVPVFFDIPSLQISAISPQVKLCIENLTIPTSVGGSDCVEWLECWLVIGTLPVTDTDPKEYSCACASSEFASGAVNNDVSLSFGRCGPSYQETWGTSCPDVRNGRTMYSDDNNYSTVQLNICPESHNTCDVCRGGQHPKLKVGLQWTNTAEQCYDQPPFTSAGSMMQNARTTTIIAGVYLLVLAHIL